MPERKRRMFPRWPRFGGPDLHGKSVILIGPAATVTEELEGVDLAEFDFVARMNNSINTPITYRGAPYFTHNLYIRNQQPNSAKSLAGRLDQTSAERCGTRVVVFVLSHWHEILRLVRKVVGIWRMGLDVEIYVLGPGLVRRAAASITPVKPTLGFVTLRYLLEANPKRLHVVGFTFFTTKYIDAYNDRVKVDADALAWSRRNGKHNPEVERLTFRRQYEDAVAAGKPVTLGAGVLRALYGNG
ncbi:hypothetical protein [Rhodobacter ferrooxidans]|uniref:Uncharacterized protein n=1 Tax=Rhodobacter ferrooxidans TaxID=371731 RepID=C8S074_9RHOB|nr:hypothetical protein [Rhodobacter sp. SW2]EEW25683.1 hypothetical protein Rsw2DRAFT_1452 [Rhodobacter sp. SW2]